MAAAWPERAGDPFADKMNSIAKYVVTDTLGEDDLHLGEHHHIPGPAPSPAPERAARRPGRTSWSWASPPSSVPPAHEGLVDQADAHHRARDPGGGKRSSRPTAPSGRSSLSRPSPPPPACTSPPPPRGRRLSRGLPGPAHRRPWESRRGLLGTLGPWPGWDCATRRSRGRLAPYPYRRLPAGRSRRSFPPPGLLRGRPAAGRPATRPPNWGPGWPPRPAPPLDRHRRPPAPAAAAIPVEVEPGPRRVRRSATAPRARSALGLVRHPARGQPPGRLAPVHRGSGGPVRASSAASPTSCSPTATTSPTPTAGRPLRRPGLDPHRRPVAAPYATDLSRAPPVSRRPSRPAWWPTRCPATPGQRRVRHRRAGLLLGRLAGLEPRARRPHRLPGRQLVLVEGPDRLPAGARRAVVVRMAPARPRRPGPPPGRRDARSTRRPDHPHGRRWLDRPGCHPARPRRR